MNTPLRPPITEYLYQKACRLGSPISGTFELTPLCNLSCKMCYVRLTKQQQQKIGQLRDADTWLKLGQQCKDAGLLYLLLTGGEPFSHPQFQQIYTGLHNLGLVLTVNTNGTLLEEETVAWLQKTPPARLNISLYGATNEAYASLCGVKDGFTRVQQAIDRVLQAGICVKLNCSLTPMNAHELPQVAAFAKERNLPLQVAAYMFPPIRRDPGAFGENQRFTPQQAAHYQALAAYYTAGKEVFLENADRLQMNTDPCESPEDTTQGLRCRAGKCSFWVTWEGTLLPCGMFPCDQSPNVFTQDFAGSWETVTQQARAIRLPAQCAACEHRTLCHACGAMVYTESGNFDSVPQYRCDMTKAYKEEYRRLANKLREDAL